MASIFQKLIKGDVDSLGTQVKDSSQKILYKSEQFGSTADKSLSLKYIVAVVTGSENADIAANGEIAFEVNGNWTRVTVPFHRSNRNGKAFAQAAQALQVVIPPNTKIIVSIPVFFAGGGANGGAEVALTGVYEDA